MAQFASMFKQEVARVARKETRKLTQAGVALVRELRVQQRKHRAEIDSLQRELRAVIKFVRGMGPTTPGAAAKADATAKSRERITAKGLIAMRKRTQLSAADFGRLAGVTAQTVYNWEQGKSEPRESQKAALLKLRGMGRRAALAALGELEAKPAAVPARSGRKPSAAKRARAGGRAAP
jgi:DNA-binding transcriptional regulator YiaG